MRWLDDPLKDSLGYERCIDKFLWFPLCLQNEWRWLEKTRIIQRVLQMDVGGSCQWGCFRNRWVSVAWADRGTFKQRMAEMKKEA